jgi:LPS export ABC transporter permease LptF/LPS export ABC transporter permease LptG
MITGDMRRLDRYIFWELLPPTLMSLALYVFLLLMNVLFALAREAIQNDLSLLVVLKLLYFQLPQLLVITLPMSVLMGSLIGIGRLSADSEIIAIQAAGVPLRRMAIPTLAIGLAAALTSFYFVAFVSPQGAYAHHQMKREVYLSQYTNTDRIVPRVFHTQVPGLLLYYDEREEETGAFIRVFLYEEDAQTLTERVTVAHRGELSFDPETGRINLYLEDGSTHVRRLSEEPGESYSVMTFASYQESREAPGYIRAFSGGLRKNLKEMSLPDLRQQVEAARAEPNAVVRQVRLSQAQAEFHERFALPAAAIVFALLGLPLGVVNRRGGKSSGFAMSLGIVLVYWVGYSILRGVAEKGQMNAAIALWIPNAAFALVAIFLIVTRFRRAPSGRLLGGLGTFLNRLASFRLGRGQRPASSVPEPEAMPQPPPFPQLIDRYVAASFLKVFGFVLLSVYLVYILVEFRALVQHMVDNKIPFTTVLHYLVFMLPRMTLTTLPVACLVATLVGIGTMARAREDTAIKAAGVSVYRLMVPLLMVTALICGAAFILQDEVLPTTNPVADRLWNEIRGRTPSSQDPRHRWVKSTDGRLLMYKASDPGNRSFQGLSVFDLDPSTYAMRSRIFASQAGFDGSLWNLGEGWERDFNAEGNRLESWSEVDRDLAVKSDIFHSEDSVLLWGIQREPEQMSYRDQSAYIRDLQRRGYDTIELQVALARKITFPLVPLFMVLLGFPFSFRVGTHGSLFGIGLAIAMTVVYWSAMAVFGALGSAEILPPLLAAWAPNVFFGGLGLYLSLHLRT